jgi:hypothetical protein
MNWARVWFGSVVAALGLVFLLDYAGSLDAGDVISTWWPLLVIAAGALSLMVNRRQWLVPLVVVGLGVIALLRTTGLVESMAVAGPVLLVVLGVMVMLGRGVGGQVGLDRVRSFSVFSGTEIASHSQKFEGGSIGAVFGGAELDLRDAAPVPGAALDVFVAFGGAEVKVPRGWQVITHGLPIFGGFGNVTAKEETPANAPVLDINATVLFGGLEVKH